MKYNFFGKQFKIVFLSIIFFELLSFLGYLVPAINMLVFFIILLLALVLALRKLEYGVYILLVELFIGSKGGDLFSLGWHGLNISLRIGLFLVIMGVWLFNLIRYQWLKKSSAVNDTFSVRKLEYFKWYLILAVFLLWGVVWGFARGNSFSNIFFDFNAWPYFLLVVVFSDVIKSKETIKKILPIFFAALLDIAMKTIVALYFFTHNFSVVKSLYSWIRTSGVGEITPVDGIFQRIFLQSQIYALMGIFIVLALILFIRQTKVKDRFLRNNQSLLLIFFTLLLATVMISLSRSFWLGGTAGFVLFAAILICPCWKARASIEVKPRATRGFTSIALFRLVLITVATFIIAFSLIVAVVNFPYRSLNSHFWLGGFMGERAITFTGEAAVSSRWSLLPPLWTEITEHPILGSGFGATVTYQSSDPRVLQSSPGGWYTTYALEWGYLDIWLKIGLFGLLFYLFLIWKIWQSGWQAMRQAEDEEDRFLALGLLAGLVALLVTHAVSPYLNHPLGIGYLILCSVVFARLSNHKLNADSR